MKNGTLTVIPPENPAQDPQFSTARRFAGEFIEHGRRSILAIMLLGGEVDRLRRLHGIKHGGARGASSSKLNLNWPEFLEAQIPMSYQSIHTGWQMWVAAKKFIPILNDPEVQQLPFDKLPVAKQQQVRGAIKKGADSKTMGALALEWGVRKPAGANLDKDRNPGGNSTKKKSTPEEEAQEHFRAALVTLMGLRLDSPDTWLKLLHYLPLERESTETVNDRISLTDALEELGIWQQAVEDVRKKIARALHGSRKADAAERMAEAREKVLSTS